MTVLMESKPLPALKNSPEAIRRFPFPFASDSYGYSVNLVPAGQGKPGTFDANLFDIDEHYHTEMQERARILAEDGNRRCLTLPHMMDAQWDFLRDGHDPSRGRLPGAFHTDPRPATTGTGRTGCWTLIRRLRSVTRRRCRWSRWNGWGGRCRATSACWISAKATSI